MNSKFEKLFKMIMEDVESNNNQNIEDIIEDIQSWEDLVDNEQYFDTYLNFLTKIIKPNVQLVNKILKDIKFKWDWYDAFIQETLEDNEFLLLIQIPEVLADSDEFMNILSQEDQQNLQYFGEMIRVDDIDEYELKCGRNIWENDEDYDGYVHYELDYESERINKKIKEWKKNLGLIYGYKQNGRDWQK